MLVEDTKPTKRDERLLGRAKRRKEERGVVYLYMVPLTLLYLIKIEYIINIMVGRPKEAHPKRQRKTKALLGRGFR